MRHLLLLFLLSCCFAPAAASQRQDDLLYGAQVRVQSISGPQVTGELLAVSTDSLWMLADLRLAAFPLRDVVQVRIDRGTPSTKLAWTWALIGGAVTGAALTAACSSVKGTSGCGSLFAASVVPFVLAGGIGAASLAHSRYETFEFGRDPELLRAHARFPKGLPPGVSRDSLASRR
jgi:hypothetical protein